MSKLKMEQTENLSLSCIILFVQANWSWFLTVLDIKIECNKLNVDKKFIVE